MTDAEKEWWEPIPVVIYLDEVFGPTCSGRLRSYASFADPDDIRWLWDADYRDCMLRIRLTHETMVEYAAPYTGWIFIVFGDALRAYNTLEETVKDKARERA